MIIKSIEQLLANRTLVSVSPEHTVRQACEVLKDHDVGALVVLHRGRLIGVISERDVIHRCICRNRPTAQTRVDEVMTADPVTIHYRESLATAQDRMFEGSFRHLPVVDDDNNPVGMLSMRDIPTEYRLMVERFRDYTSAPA